MLAHRKDNENKISKLKKSFSAMKIVFTYTIPEDRISGFTQEGHEKKNLKKKVFPIKGRFDIKLSYKTF